MSDADGVGVGVGVGVVDVLVEVVDDVEVVVCTEEAEAVVEPVEDGKMRVETSPAMLVNIWPRFPEFCVVAEVAVPCSAELDVEPLGTKPPRTPLRPCLLLRKRWWNPRYGSITRRSEKRVTCKLIRWNFLNTT